METLQISKANALIAYQSADVKGKALLSNLFGKKVFIGKVIDRIQTFDDVLEELSIKPTDFKDCCKGLSDDEIAYRQIKLIAQAYNEGWKPDWLDSDQCKYYPYFRAPAVGSGVGFSYYACDCAYSGSGVGSRLVFANSELAIDAGKKFVEIYNRFLKP